LGTRRGRADDAIACRSAATLSRKKGGFFRRGYLLSPLQDTELWQCHVQDAAANHQSFFLEFPLLGGEGLCRFHNFRCHFSVQMVGWVLLYLSTRCTRRGDGSCRPPSCYELPSLIT
jgi:hypothetical protein